MQAQLNQELVIKHFLHIYMQQVCMLVKKRLGYCMIVYPDVTSNDAA